MNNITITPDRQRGDFERSLGEIATQRNLSIEVAKTGYKHMPHVLRLGALLIPGQNSYVFNVKKSVDVPLPGEVKMDTSVAFTVTAIGIRFSKVDYNGGAYSNHGNYPHLTYPDPAYFDGAPASGATKKEYEALQCVLNGTIEAQVAGDKIFDGIAANYFVYNPTGTYTDATAATVAHPAFGGSVEKQGFSFLTPQFVLQGENDNTFVLNIASGDRSLIDGNLNASGAESGKRNIVWLYLLGFKVKNFTANPQSLTACRVI